MCWTMEASIVVAGAGAVATVVARQRGEPAAIWLTLGYFTLMEALQVAGYMVVDECGTTANRTVTMVSFLHIVFQPFLINAFAMELVPGPVRARVRAWVFGLCGVSAAVMLVQLLPIDAAGQCAPGAVMCAERLCTVSGDWHIAWDIPFNGLLNGFDQRFGLNMGFPTYMIAVFILPLIYGSWRFVVFHLIAGPILASMMTENPNEMPAVWCIFSVGLLLAGLSPAIRRGFTARTWWGREVSA